ncbi:MAG: hypothetical protein KDA79_09765, partial [Planctomycetaceae bacterium]|nr:hypothetical protein [Planctomycetaceae bacterium]
RWWKQSATAEISTPSQEKGVAYGSTFSDLSEGAAAGLSSSAFGHRTKAGTMSDHALPLSGRVTHPQCAMPIATKRGRHAR